MYNALSTEPELKARTNSLSVNVWFNHETHGNYTLQDGDDCILHTELVNDYVDAETFAADCMAVMQAAQAENLALRGTASAPMRTSTTASATTWTASPPTRRD